LKKKELWSSRPLLIPNDNKIVGLLPQESSKNVVIVLLKTPKKHFFLQTVGLK
jgi:hypothetical protein